MERKEILERAIHTYGIHAQVDMCLEEMSELSKALLKMRRSGGDIADKLDNIREEIADVQIMIDQMKMIYGEELIEKIERLKLARLENRLASEVDGHEQT